MIWVDGSLNGQEMRKSLGTRNWQRALEEILKWESEGRVANEQKPEPLTVKEACENFISDARARGLREPTLYKYQLLFRQLQSFALDKGFRFLQELEIELLREFRASWPNRNIAARKKLENLKAFFRFAHESGWIANNSAAKLKRPKLLDNQLCRSLAKNLG